MAIVVTGLARPSVTSRPVISVPSASIVPSIESGSSAAAAFRPSRPIAVPDANSFDAAAAAAVALAAMAVDVDDGVAEFGARAGRTTKDLAVEQMPPPIPVPIVSIEAHFLPLGGALDRLGEHRHVGVVVENDGQADTLGDHVTDRNVVECRGWPN